MTRAATVPTLLFVMALLTACNTTDALTPQVGIGDSSGGAPSSPVTQREAEGLAGTRQPVFAAGSQPNGYHPAYNQSQGTYRPGSGAPPTTMQEQADALSRNSTSPAASAPIEGQALPPAAAGAGSQAQSGQTLDAQPQQTAALTPGASSARGNTVRFLPIIGAPVQAVTPLSRQLGAEGAGARPFHQELERCEQRLHPQRLSLRLQRRRQGHRGLCLGHSRQRRRPPAPHSGAGKRADGRDRSLGGRSGFGDAADRLENHGGIHLLAAGTGRLVTNFLQISKPVAPLPLHSRGS